MRVCIATVSELSGKVTAIDEAGVKRLLAIGDQLFINEVVRTAYDSTIELFITDGAPVKIEALQSIKLTEELSFQELSDSTDSVLTASLSTEVITQLFSAYPFGTSSILSDIEPVYELKDFQPDSWDNSKETALILDDILQPAQESSSLERFLQFDQTGEVTTVYFSIQGSFTDSNSAQLHADKMITINSVGYNDSAELLSYLIQNYQLIEQS